MNTEKLEPVLITDADIKTIAGRAIRRNGTAEYTPRVLRSFFEFAAEALGINLNMETEEMRNERLKREAKETRGQRNAGAKLARRASRRAAGDF